ncbi:hypothetical protein HK101_005626, partial [Irineochytrium annulatum]
MNTTTSDCCEWDLDLFDTVPVGQTPSSLEAIDFAALLDSPLPASPSAPSFEPLDLASQKIVGPTELDNMLNDLLLANAQSYPDLLPDAEMLTMPLNVHPAPVLSPFLHTPEMLQLHAQPHQSSQYAPFAPYPSPVVDRPQIQQHLHLPLHLVSQPAPQLPIGTEIDPVFTLVNGFSLADFAPCPATTNPPVVSQDDDLFHLLNSPPSSSQQLASPPSSPRQLVHIPSPSPEPTAATSTRRANVPRAYPCPEPNCSKSFHRPHHLASHALSHRPEVRDFPCDECDQTFQRKHDLARHQRTSHSDARPHG